ncbi:MAG: hypothetical protein A2Y17_08430 [Clostridiales bacterium GWF2_38_85]|nr:MAG: hypothetical protein A2Y17_08430 [Clostridiales bacterium GWF2_38_85]HBL83781.1 hypothetical protein [Clostridiales bacterium]
MSNNEKYAVIIGAGPAGLTAAYKLLKETDYIPVIIEESDNIGGISRTAVHNNNRMDIGGHRFFSKSDEIMNFWMVLMPLQGQPAYDDKKLGVEKKLAEGGPDPEKEDRVFLIRRRVSRIFYLRKFFDYPISIKPETIKAMGFARTMKAGFGYVRAAIFKLKENSLEDFYINRFGVPLYKMFFKDYTEKVWGISPSKISADWGAQRVKGLSLMKAVWAIISKPFKKGNSKNVETSLIEEYYYPKKGPGQLWETLAGEVEELGGKIIINTKVVEVKCENNKITGVVAENKDGVKATLSAEIFFSTMPVKDLVAAINMPVPKDVAEIASKLPYRDFITVGLLVDKLLIENKTKMKTLGNIVPDCWIYVQERDVKLGRIQIFNNWSPYMVDKVDDKVWIGLEYFCNEGDDLWDMTDEDFINFAIDELVKINIINRSDVSDSVRIRVKKAYPAYFGTYKQFDKVKDYLDTFDNLYCIGRNGQHRYNNMDHSMLSAMEAVKAVKGESDKNAVWNVNTEGEYHEKK